MTLNRFGLVLWLALVGCSFGCIGGCKSGTSVGVDSAPETPGSDRGAPSDGASGGGDSRAQPRLPMGEVEIEAPPREPLKIKVEVAETDAQRQMGLMYREHMGADEGMIFLFPTERYNSFWMRNTVLSLDMLFIDADWTIVGILHDVPPLNDEQRRVSKMSQYVLEVNAGVAAAHQLSVGAKVRFTPPAGAAQ